MSSSDTYSTNFGKRFTETEFALSMFLEWDNYVFVAVGLAMVLLARYLHVVPYWFLTGQGIFKPSLVKMNHLLITEDNKAVAVSLAAFILSLGIVVNGQAATNGNDLPRNVAQLLIWVPISFFLLFLARFFNLFMVVGRRAVGEMLQKENLGVAFVEAGAVTGSAFIVRATTSGDASVNFVEDLGSTALYFVLGQVVFVLWATILARLVLRVKDLEDVLVQGNPAAGASIGFNLFAMGFILSIPISNTDSLWGFLVWIVLAAIAVLSLRFVVGKIMLFGQDMNSEILEDKNYGVAIIEGVSILFIALVVDTFVGLDTENNVVACDN